MINKLAERIIYYSDIAYKITLLSVAMFFSVCAWLTDLLGEVFQAASKFITTRLLGDKL